MPVVSFVSSKGGVGKSTNCAALAGEIAHQLSESGNGVALIDTDPNKHTRFWSELPNCPDNVEYYETDPDELDLIDVIEKAKEQKLFVLIDSEGGAKESTQQLVSQSDLVLIVCKHSTIDAIEAVKTVRMIRNTEKMCRRKINHAVLFTEVDPAISTKLAREIESTIKTNDVPVFKSSSIKRLCFKLIFSEGGTFRTLLADDSRKATRRDKESLQVGIDNLIAMVGEIQIRLVGDTTDEPTETAETAETTDERVEVDHV